MAWLTAQHPVGTVLEPVSKRFSTAMFAAPGGAKTIHNDQQAAEAEGLPRPIAVGPQVAALVFRMLRHAYGEGWIVGGRVTITFRRPVWCDDFATAKGVVTSLADEGDQVRVGCEVWVETARGEKAIVGEASGLVPRGPRGGTEGGS